ncbi:MAG: hypothetical protein AAGH64_08245 [Planctomycetota bacterium]
MRTTRVILETVNALVLGVWAGMLVFVGVAAALTFPLMKRLDPTLAGFEEYSGEHWRLAAGSVMNPLFEAVATAGWVGAAVVIVVQIALHNHLKKTSIGRWLRWRLLGVLILAGVTFFANSTLWGSMVDLFEQSLSYARAGDHAGYRITLEEFDRLHDIATPWMGAQFLSVVGFMVVSLVMAFRCWRPATPEGAR